MSSHEHYMRLAIAKAREGIAAGQSPFGACVVRDGSVISCEHNVVMRTTDITAHAEVHAIRTACARLGEIELRGCVIYSTCEPCPMCFSACHWAKIASIVFGTRIADARDLGFGELDLPNDTMKQLGGSPVAIIGDVLRDESLALFAEWAASPNRRTY